MDPNDKEYYPFFKMGKDGLDRCRFAVFSYTSNGDLKSVGATMELRCSRYHASLSEIRKRFQSGTAQRVRSESY